MNNINTNNLTRKADDSIQSHTCTSPSFTFPACRFAEDARCRNCGYYSVSDGWCYRHKTWTDGDKWACSSYQ